MVEIFNASIQGPTVTTASQPEPSNIITPSNMQNTRLARVGDHLVARGDSSSAAKTQLSAGMTILFQGDSITVRMHT